MPRLSPSVRDGAISPIEPLTAAGPDLPIFVSPVIVLDVDVLNRFSTTSIPVKAESFEPPYCSPCHRISGIATSETSHRQVTNGIAELVELFSQAQEQGEEIMQYFSATADIVGSITSPDINDQLRIMNDKLGLCFLRVLEQDRRLREIERALKDIAGCLEHC
ncbi:hypothetical protein FHETE_5763 [Fusarium heterosporum]|uniref:Uncharacterized protein n=1 Tax=Fusarium heterosporum TaxID=42747 RepID=A0A8H5T7H1_FUSHE|nr:hypothetical protein FHETE_5763 [Fusarium heterosporum]